MTEWYYSKGGNQQGPVSFEQLCEIARNGGLHPTHDLVWTSAMKDWKPSGQVPELMQRSESATPTSGIPETSPSNPYATPDSAWTHAASIIPSTALEEIPPGSEPIDIMACVKRGFTITGRHFGTVLLVGLIYLGISFGADMILTALDDALGLAPIRLNSSENNLQQQGSPLNILLGQILAVFLSLGATRIGLNLISGEPATVGMLFSGGPKLLRAAVATLLYSIMVGLGMLLLIVPGVYLALRFGMYQSAIVDRNLGIMDAFKYSSQLTTNNRMNLFGLAVISLLMILGGCLALMIGILFALPVIWLSWIAAYRWMQYGHRALQDQH